MKRLLNTFFAIGSFAVSAMLLGACVKDIDKTVGITTTAVSEITEATAVSGGTITKDGGSDITAYGVCWSAKSSSPTVSDSKTTDGKGIGSFTSKITGLTPGTEYSVRAYATNGNGTTYGESVTFKTTSIAPTVKTTSISGVTYEEAYSGGSIVSDGGSAVTACGVCWGTSENPEITGNKTTDDIVSNAFISHITGLQPDITYYVRAYATNALGTAYGEQVSFSTSTEPTVSVEDNAFSQYLINNFDTNHDGKIQISEAAAVENIDCNSLGIASLKGIENFANLKELRCQTNNLSTLDLTGNKNLEVRWAFDNANLSSINVKGLAGLKYLHAYKTSLASIDVGDCVSLLELVLNDTPLTTLDLTYNNQLTLLAVQMTAMDKLDVSNKTSLVTLLCNDSPMSSLNVSGCSSLTDVHAQFTSIPSFNFAGLAGLKYADIHGNKCDAATINANGCSILAELYGYDSKFTAADLTGCSALQIFRCFNNTFGSLDFSDCSSVTEINVNANSTLSSIKVGSSITPKLYWFGIQNSQIKELDLSNITTLHVFDAGNSLLEKVNVKGCSDLTEFYVYNCHLTDLDLSGLSNLNVTWGFGNGSLTKLNLNGCTSLTYMDYNSSAISELDLSGLSKLERAILWNNNISKLTIKDNTALVHINLENNSALTSLDLSGAPNMDNLILVNTRLTSFDATKNTNLTNLAIRDVPTLEKLTLGNNPKLVNIYCWNSLLTTLDLRACADAMNEVWVDANSKLTTIYVRSNQTIASFHHDAGASILNN